MTRPTPEHKVVICHGDSGVHPYVEIEVDVASIFKQGHDEHLHQGRTDVIPPFDYVGILGIVQHYPGLGDQSILANDCAPVLPPPPPPPPSSTTSTSTTSTSTTSTTSSTSSTTTSSTSSTTTTTTCPDCGPGQQSIPPTSTTSTSVVITQQSLPPGSTTSSTSTTTCPNCTTTTVRLTGSPAEPGLPFTSTGQPSSPPASPGGGALAFTGGDAGLSAIIGGALLLGGAAMIRARRWRG